MSISRNGTTHPYLHQSINQGSRSADHCPRAAAHLFDEVILKLEMVKVTLSRL